MGSLLGVFGAHVLILSLSLQGAIFLFFAGRAEEIKGNIDEVNLTT